MIINRSVSQDTIIEGDIVSKKATINADKIGKLQSMLTMGLYEDAVGATITELSNNMIDSVVQSGKNPKETPSIVEIFNIYNDSYIEFRDKGLGLSKDDFENVVMNYLTSTKEDSNDVIGSYGIGAKVWVSLNRSSEWICRKDGTEWKFLAYKGDEFLEYDEIYKKETTEENGVTIRIKIKDWYEKEEFKRKAREKLSFYDEIILILEGRLQQNTIYRNDLFQWSSMFHTYEMTFSLKDVLYDIDWNQLEIPKINIPLNIRFNLDSGIIPTISRESIIYNNFTKELIKTKIKDIADYLFTLYNDSIKEVDTFIEAYPKIDNTDYSVIISDKRIDITQLQEYSSYTPKKIEVKNVNINNLTHYKQNIDAFFDEYTILNIDNSKNVWVSSKFNREKNLKKVVFDANNIKIVEVNTPVVRKIKSFLRNKYGSDTYYVIHNTKRKLGGRIISENFENTYKDILDLLKLPKSEWRERIKEFQYIENQIRETFIKEYDVQNSEEFIQWMKEKNDELKKYRKSDIKRPNYKGINKAKGDITISVAVENKFKKDVRWDKVVNSIETLSSLKGIHVYFDRTETILINVYEYTKIFPRIKFIKLNPTEIKHVIGLNQFFHFNEFKKMRTFNRMATALYAKEIMSIKPSNTSFILEAFPKWIELTSKVERYINNNLPTRISDEIKEVFLEEVKATNNWDFNIYSDILELKAIFDKFYFVDLIEINNSHSDDQKRLINNILYVMYKNHKITGKGIDEFQLVPTSALCIETSEKEESITQEAELI